LNWDFWLGPVPLRPFNKGIYHPGCLAFQNWLDLDNGMLAGQGAHTFDLPVRALKLESYAGVALTDEAGRPMGVVAVAGMAPLADPDFVTSPLELVAPRAEVELRQRRARLALAESEDRYRRLIEERKEFPDLVVIDGGRGQVAAALKAFVGLECMPPPIIGLAKKEETIIFPDERKPLNLPPGDPGLGLLQRLRDEAHRFANTYNADLRSRKIKESILDDCPGLGPKRRLALLAHFGSIEKLRAASVEQISKVPGFGPKAAARLHGFLHTP
ncbi:MAG: hypothetical protein HYV75_04630, partial [Opitutae bacterium]|nr:hypothetical protein [Opitutae bacterium]